MPVKLKGVTTYVLDEPEPILSAKDGQFLLEVLSRPPRPQIIVAGATFGLGSEKLINGLMSEKLERAKSETAPLQDNIKHYKLKVRDAGDRDLQLARFLEAENDRRTIVYVNQAHLIRHVYRYLKGAGFVTVTVSQDRTKQQCKQAIRDFDEGRAHVLLTTDRAATGIDIRGVSWVAHYEPARSPQAYVHRAGRTGRAGEKGNSLSLVSENEFFILKKFARELGVIFKNYWA